MCLSKSGLLVFTEAALIFQSISTVVKSYPVLRIMASDSLNLPFGYHKLPYLK